MAKDWLTYQEQLERLQGHGLVIGDTDACHEFLSCVNYYRFSGYFRHWQIDPEQGNDHFVPGTSFASIQGVYDGGQLIAGRTMLALRQVELLLRTKFAYHYTEQIGPVGTLLHGKGLTQPGNRRFSVEDRLLRDLGRSKDADVARYRDDSKTKRGRYLPSAYDTLPVWVAVESLSFGTLSHCIQASKQSGVADAIADSMNVSRKVLASQIKSFVYVRNRIAHHAKLWNHSVLDAPKIGANIKRRAAEKHGEFEPRSVYAVLVALDAMLTRSNAEDDWLVSQIDPLLDNDVLLDRGFKTPRKYGEMDLEVT